MKTSTNKTNIKNMNNFHMNFFQSPGDKPKQYKLISPKDQIYQCFTSILYIGGENFNKNLSARMTILDEVTCQYKLEWYEVTCQYKLEWYDIPRKSWDPNTKESEITEVYIPKFNYKTTNFDTGYFMRYNQKQLYVSRIYMSEAEYKQLQREVKLKRVIGDDDDNMC